MTNLEMAIIEASDNGEIDYDMRNAMINALNESAEDDYMDDDYMESYEEDDDDYMESYEEDDDYEIDIMEYEDDIRKEIYEAELMGDITVTEREELLDIVTESVVTQGKIDRKDRECRRLHDELMTIQAKLANPASISDEQHIALRNRADRVNKQYTKAVNEYNKLQMDYKKQQKTVKRAVVGAGTVLGAAYMYNKHKQPRTDSSRNNSFVYKTNHRDAGNRIGMSNKVALKAPGNGYLIGQKYK